MDTISSSYQEGAAAVLAADNGCLLKKINVSAALGASYVDGDFCTHLSAISWMPHIAKADSKLEPVM
jgi:hypothetical protein